MIDLGMRVCVCTLCQRVYGLRVNPKVLFFNAICEFWFGAKTPAKSPGPHTSRLYCSTDGRRLHGTLRRAAVALARASARARVLRDRSAHPTTSGGAAVWHQPARAAHAAAAARGASPESARRGQQLTRALGASAARTADRPGRDHRHVARRVGCRTKRHGFRSREWHARRPPRPAIPLCRREKAPPAPPEHAGRRGAPADWRAGTYNYIYLSIYLYTLLLILTLQSMPDAAAPVPTGGQVPL